MITGVLALVIGSALGSWPLGMFGGGLGLALGIIGLRRARLSGGSSPLAVGAITVSFFSVLVGLFALLAVVADSVEGRDEGARQTEEQSAARKEGPSDEAQVPSDGEPLFGVPFPAEQLNAEGPGLGDPATTLGLGETATINGFEVTVIAIDMDADALVVSATPGNPAPDGQYVLVTVSARNAVGKVRYPVLDLRVAYLAADDYIYDQFTCGAYPARPAEYVMGLQLDQSAEYEVCMDVPLGVIGEPRVVVYDPTSESGDAWMWSAH